jgi:hypothetical protein
VAVIDSILKEEIARLRSLRAHYVAKNAAIPPGSVVIKQRSGRPYAYRLYRKGGRVVTLYIGPASSPKVKKLSASLSQRRKIRAEIKAVDANAARLKKMLSVR